MISILFLATGIPILILGIIMIGLKKVFGAIFEGHFGSVWGGF